MIQRIDTMALRAQMARLEQENERLRKENEFLKSHPTLVAGMKGEVLIANLTGGHLTSYAAEHDITLKNEAKIEVKFSNHRPDENSKNIPQRNRWAWNKPEGHLNRGKDYDFLLLVGSKDLRHTEEYLDDSPFVYFLLPTASVRAINSTVVRGRSQGGTLNLDTDLYGIREGWVQRHLKSKRRQFALLTHMVPEQTIRELETCAIPRLLSLNREEAQDCRRRSQSPNPLQGLPWAVNGTGPFF